ncbi:hypothetical protein [Paenibacillus agricola]|uniref:Uncharacterized protein n=1 Tax=Paenibacillus agricola TaxID=2716264 RepID=A0ABX0J8N7_9BACL|nr:hypothetical protein [Paenibacillus agricola]NHN30504.1 hypothetical protein [Paenibacillus agricola]
MSIIQILVISALLWLVTCSLALVLFRYKPATYWKEIGQVTGMMILVTLAIQRLELSFLAPLIQLIFGVVGFKLFLKFKWIHAAIMIIYSYEICRIIEKAYMYIQNKFALKDSIVILRNMPIFGDALIIISIVLMLTAYLHLSRIGFTFISRHQSIHLPVHIFCFSVILLAILYSISLSFAFTDSYFILLLRSIVILLLIYFLYASYKKEMNDEF